MTDDRAVAFRHRLFAALGFVALSPMVSVADTAQPDTRCLPVAVSAAERPASEDALARFWARNGLAEHSSVAGFNRFALDLLAHGAPPALVARAQIAAAQEIELARLCFALASAYAGEPLGPGPLAMGESAPIAADLASLAAATAREGCVGETLARSVDPGCAVMTAIVEEEAAHAELAWATLRWALARGGPAIRQAVREAFADATPRAEGDGGPADAALIGHGLLYRDAIAAVMARGMATIVQPAARLLAAPLTRPGAPSRRG